MMHDKERLIQEKRLTEAKHRNYLGLEGKFGVILKNLGKPVLANTGGYFTSNEGFDVWDLGDEDDIPTADIDEIVMEVGMIYSGLSQGLHLEINYLDENRGMKVYFNGYLVFYESDEGLNCYVPGKKWEEKIDELYKIAKEREKKTNKRLLDEFKKEAAKEKISFLQQLKDRWGI